MSTNSSVISKIIKFFKILYWSALRFGQKKEGTIAIALTYSTLFALVPMMAMFFGMAKGFALDGKFEEKILSEVSTNREVLVYIFDFAKKMLNQTSGGVVAGLGVLTLIYTVIMLVNNVDKAFNSVWELRDRSGFFNHIGEYLVFLFLVPVILLLLSGARVVVSGWLSQFGSEKLLLWYSFLLGQAIPFGIIVLVFFLVYLLVPHTTVKCSSAFLAAIVASLLFLSLQEAFIFSQRCIFSYNKVYGSFAILPLFLIWLQWSWSVALFGAEVSVVSQKYSDGLLDSTFFEASLHSHLRRRLAILKIIGCNFMNDKGSTSFAELLERVGEPPVVLEYEVDFLLKNNFIEQVVGQGKSEYKCFLPSYAPEQLTLVDAVNRIDKAGKNAENSVLDQEMCKIDAELSKLNDSNCKSTGNRALFKF